MLCFPHQSRSVYPSQPQCPEETWKNRTRPCSFTSTGAPAEVLDLNTPSMESSIPWRCDQHHINEKHQPASDSLNEIQHSFITSVCCYYYIYKSVLLCVLLSHQLHIVHMKQRYNRLEDALKDPSGIAVLGFFYEV